jgi:hypothetical protein
MKKSIFYFTFFLAVGMIACNNGANEHKGHGKDNEPKSQADSLKKAIDDDHIIGMSKMGRLTRAERSAGRLLDSISKLPAKARQAAEPLKAKLDSLQKELSYAETAMDKWMNELKRDSVVNQMEMEERIKYLVSEKLKASKVKENILKGLQKADSLIKDKF